MGRNRGPYCEEFPVGTRVRVANRAALEEFMRTWKYHHKLEAEQLEHAGVVAAVKWLGFYHGGDELYALDGVPGIWHEQCLSLAHAGL